MGYYKDKVNEETEKMILLKVGARKRLYDCAGGIREDCEADGYLENIRENVKTMVMILALLDDQQKNIDWAKQRLEEHPESDDEEAEG